MKTALIFGISGFVGKYLAQELMTHGYTVYGSDAVGNLPALGIGFTMVDLLDTQKIADLIANVKPDAVINLAAISSVGQSWKMPQTTMQVNVIGALNILEAIRVWNLKVKLLFIGSSEEYAESSNPINEKSPLDTNNPYGISKMTLEKFVDLYRNRYGMKVYYVRAFNHTGIGQRDTFVIPNWCKQVAAISNSGKPGVLTVGNLSVKRDFSHVKDVVRAYRMILESDDCEKVYNVGSGQALALKELVGYIISLSDQPVMVEIDQTLIRPVDTPVICCDHSLISQQLGWKPEFSVFDAVNEMVAFYKQMAYE
jgi:GDP-4-dehydro-6-deoxy-D-mannose reductase